VSKQLFDIDTFRAQPLPSEEEVMANWQGDIENPMVSVLCNTFNQKMYIEDAFRGFLIQKTDFVFEVIVHDDASTDGTSDIVRKYAKLYPKIFKSVIQTENQYLKGKRIIPIGISHAKSNYIALCEGDDFWCSEDKLSKQLSVLIEHPEINLVVHDAYVLQNNKSNYQFINYSDKECILSYDLVYKTARQFSPTASMLFKKEGVLAAFEKYAVLPVGDFLLETFLGKPGIYYLPEKMSVYRREALGSWSSNTLYDINKKLAHCNRMIEGLNVIYKDLPTDKKDLVRFKTSAVYNELASAYLSVDCKKAMKYEICALKLNFSRFKSSVFFLLRVIKRKMFKVNK
jgi:glycosyltransferase involved in cell wall biosynthesis